MSYWLGTGVSKQIDKYLDGTFVLEDDSSFDFDEPPFSIWCSYCGFDLVHMLWFSECGGIIFNKVPKYCPECGKFHNRNILDTETNTTYFIRSKETLAITKNPKDSA